MLIIEKEINLFLRYKKRYLKHYFFFIQLIHCNICEEVFL
ncbi:hypothetical protein LEP1GSC125_0241 [Leptospira mayottensis 200901122]|uniref:Uncharacterized protein n=1 Tax=Leptospira mayottensis 200901122 TaxID=1193010 RepID=A0AA87MT93_9LEPT|nr:hypothetical protein LEP1GSC125_0241 [Leptospira mayottensis 200901122]